MDVRKLIIDEQDLKREEVDVSEFWPSVGKVWVCVMSGTARDSWECSLKEWLDAKQSIIAPYLVRCLCEENGSLLFSEQDADALGKKNWLCLNKLYEVATRINKTSKGAIEELEKNSAGAVGAAS